MPGWVKDYTVCTKVCECARILGECLVFHSREQCRWMQRDSGTHDKCLHPALIAQIEAVPHLSKLDVAVSSLWYDNGMLLSEGKCKLQAVIWWHAPADTALSLSLSLSPRQRLHPRTQKRPTGEITLAWPASPTDAPLCSHCVAALIEADSRAHIDLAAC